ncbi:SgcJ/EcaC family oxidoreductase [Sphaerisporangium aureirubrum]|uniref:SgcJ/EcaC family oxidoreductase n=1 Tax=Sphaerisporangium aureirubrum TaxID=1544736 RepID=A0ABW1NFE9_9ACTN
MDDEIAAIRQLVADAQESQGDVERFLALHADEVSIVNFGGRRVRGKDALRQAMEAALKTPLADVTTTVEVADIRFARPGVAIVAGVKHVTDGREAAVRDAPGTALPSSSGWLTYVVVREQDTWLILSAQTTPIRT